MSCGSRSKGSREHHLTYRTVLPIVVEVPNHTIWMLTVMELSRTISLLAHVSRFVALTFAAGMALPPGLPSQTAKELIGDACHNELQQRGNRTLCSYVEERHRSNHVFREQVIETEDPPVRHLLALDVYV